VGAENAAERRTAAGASACDRSRTIPCWSLTANHQVRTAAHPIAAELEAVRVVTMERGSPSDRQQHRQWQPLGELAAQGGTYLQARLGIVYALYAMRLKLQLVAEDPSSVSWLRLSFLWSKQHAMPVNLAHQSETCRNVVPLLFPLLDAALRMLDEWLVAPEQQTSQEVAVWTQVDKVCRRCCCQQSTLPALVSCACFVDVAAPSAHDRLGRVLRYARVRPRDIASQLAARVQSSERPTAHLATAIHVVGGAAGPMGFHV
jgi:hypothetical protein